MTIINLFDRKSNVQSSNLSEPEFFEYVGRNMKVAHEIHRRLGEWGMWVDAASNEKKKYERLQLIEEYLRNFKEY